MILGRPVNLWLGLTTALAGFLSVTAIQVGADPIAVANIAGAGTAVLGAFIALVAGQAPTVNEGSKVNVVTPKGEANYSVKV
jgi:hypothetical protein